MKKHIYLDYAATTPIDGAVRREMSKAPFGNPSSLHFFGSEALLSLDKSRAIIANALSAKSDEIFFTGSATEANNLALLGAVSGRKNKNSNIVVSAIEHDSVMETARHLEKNGTEIRIAPVDSSGKINPESVMNLIDENTAVVSIMYVNNEIGAKEPIEEIGKLISKLRAESGSVYPFFHTDAVQAFQYFDCDVQKLGVDMLSFSSHKIYGPKGVGALFIKKNIIEYMQPRIFGGGQEKGMRSGTENVSGIAGFAKAVELSCRRREKESKRVRALKEYFWNAMKKYFPEAEKNGKDDAPHVLNIWWKGMPNDLTMIALDLAGVAISTGSACSVRAPKPSHVLSALGFDEKRAKESVRISFGKNTNISEIRASLKIFNSVGKKLKK